MLLSCQVSWPCLTQVTASLIIVFTLIFYCFLDTFTTYTWRAMIPADSSLIIEYIAVKQLLHRDEYLPDSSRGMEVPPTLILAAADNDSNSYNVYSTSVSLILLPFPDFTMPFNVLTLVSLLIVIIRQ